MCCGEKGCMRRIRAYRGILGGRNDGFCDEESDSDAGGDDMKRKERVKLFVCGFLTAACTYMIGFVHWAGRRG